MNRMMKIIAGGFFLSAAITAHAGENLIKNGTFEGTGSQSSWGAYASHSSFSCANWDFPVPSRAGLGTPNGTWIQSGLAVGSFALFIQTNAGSGEVIVRQNVGALPTGVYRIAFSYTSRPKNGNTNYLADPRPVTYVELVEAGGNVISVGSVSTTVATLSSFAANVFVPAGTYAFRFRQPETSADRANIFEGVSMTRCDARIGEKGYADLASALNAASTNDVIVLATSDDGQDAAISDASIVWNGNMPTVQVPGTLTVSGANTVAAYASAPGTYTLFAANAISLEEGATLALDSPAATDGLVRTLTVGENAVTLTVAIDPARTEMVINGDFDIPGTSAGTANVNAPNWSYSYPTGGFCVPWWNYFCTEAGGSGCGISKANGTWLATGQTNGGTYSFYGQGQIADTPMAVQEFGATPAGVYRFSFNCAARPSYLNSRWHAGIRRNGAVVHTISTGPRTNTAFSKWDAVVAIPASDTYGLQFLHFDGDGGSTKSVVLDDVSFLRTAVAGWSVADGLTTLSGTAEITPGSFVDGDAEFAAGATLAVQGDLYVPALTVAGTLTVKGAVTVSLPAAYDALEATYTLIEAGTLVFDEGASLAIDPAQVTISGDSAVRHAVLEFSGNTVVLRMRKDTLTSNNYRKSAAECVDTLFTTDANWSREHYPTNGDVNVIFNHPGTVLFDNAYTNTAGLVYLFRNGLQAPVVLDATDDAYGFDFRGSYLFMGAGAGTGFTGWTEFRRGTYAGNYFCLNGTSGSGPNSKFRIDLTGATVNLSHCLQSGYAANCENEVNVSGGVFSIGSDYNTNIQPRTKNRTRVTGGKLGIGGNLHACAGTNSEFDFEITGSEMEVARSLYADATVGSFADVRLSGGVIRADAISLPAGYGRFLFNGGALAPHAMSADWMNGARLTVAAGKSAIVDTEGKDVTWTQPGRARSSIRKGRTSPGTRRFPMLREARLTASRSAARAHSRSRRRRRSRAHSPWRAARSSRLSRSRRPRSTSRTARRTAWQTARRVRHSPSPRSRSTPARASRLM